MKRLLFVFLTLALMRAANAGTASGEYIFLVGGPSLMQWEKYKVQPHDHWWANFVRAARIRTEQIRAQVGPDAMLTWLVYKQGYIDRGVQEKQNLLEYLNSVRDKYHLHLVYIRNGDDVIDYLNNGQPRDQVKVAFFEYFGHSNRACFMFDYSSNVDSASKAFLHQDQLVGIHRNIFARGAEIRSWGCHTGEMMSQKWRAATGTRMWGVIGKTQYMMDELPILISQDGKWTN